MDSQEIDQVLRTCEGLIAGDHALDLRETGFWPVVASVKRKPDLVAKYADRIGAIDRAAFLQRVPLRFPATLGIALLSLGAFFGLFLLWLAAAFAHPMREILVLVGFGAVLLTTHNLAHFAYGSLVGIRFTDWFVDLPKRPQPGLKIDYATYLRTPARSRAWMHAAGAIVTKIVPFAVVLYALSISADWW
ncbi:MAG: hypothetical protein M3R54_12925, partial [Chloroflexota bacterium]|nr:hypothetical protein [Chloroflexota bacterium]